MGIKKESYAGQVLADISKDPGTIAVPYIIANPSSQIKLLHGDSEGYIALLKKSVDGDSQYHYKMDKIEDHLKDWLRPDSYVSMNTFFTPKRLITNLKQIRSAYVDIDCHNIGRSAEEIGYLLKTKYFGVSLPTPNLMIYSGRGLNLVWMLEPMSGLAVERWGKLQRAIYQTVKSLGADDKALDASRVFRLAGSINSKNKAQVFCETLHEQRITFDTFTQNYFPDILKRHTKPHKVYEKKKGTKVSKGKIKRIFNPYTLVKARMSDIETLSQLRNGNMEGHREYALFLYRYWALVERNNKDYAADRMLEVNASFSKPLDKREALADTKSAERYFDNDIPFRITHERVIEWLDITPEEQKHLKTIFMPLEKQRRDTISQRERRRENGVRERSEYEADRRAEKTKRLKRLRSLKEESPKATQKELAEALGVALPTVKKYLAELKV